MRPTQHDSRPGCIFAMPRTPKLQCRATGRNLITWAPETHASLGVALAHARAVSAIGDLNRILVIVLVIVMLCLALEQGLRIRNYTFRQNMGCWMSCLISVLTLVIRALNIAKPSPAKVIPPGSTAATLNSWPLISILVPNPRRTPWCWAIVPGSPLASSSLPGCRPSPAPCADTACPLPYSWDPS